jgi:hypothetical protein
MIRRFIAGMFIAVAGIALGYPAVGSADPECPANAVRIQGEVVPAAGFQDCDNDPVGGDDGLLGNAPVVGNLPGLSGLL